MRLIPIVTSIVVFFPGTLSAQAQQPPDWSAVGAALGVEGKVLPDGTYRIDVPRTEPVLHNEFGFVVPPPMVLTYAAFTGTPADAMVVGDTCALGPEINPIIDALRGGKLEIGAIHNHMLGGEPNFVFLHFQGRGNALEMAKTIRQAWDQLGKDHPQPERKPAPAPEIDGEAIGRAMGVTGAMVGGMYKVALPRPHLGTTLDGRPLPPAAIPACWAGFAPCHCGLTMVMGDTCLLRSELQAAIDGYRKHDIRIVAVHNHTLGTSPDLVFCHFAAEGDAIELAKAIREVWSSLRPPK